MIEAKYYSAIFIYAVIIITVMVCSKLANSNARKIMSGENNFGLAAIITFIFAIWIGMRPVAGVFGDTINYAHLYHIYEDSRVPVDTRDLGEWMWTNLMFYCSQNMDVSMFFTLVDIGYFGCTLWACKRLMPNNVLAAMLFNLGAYSFFSYSTNGLRNGLACSVVLLALSFANGNVRQKVTAAVLGFIAINIHKTTALPLLMLILSLTCIRSFKWAYGFWLFSILLSLLFGNAISDIFAGLGFDDRLSYLTDEADENTFSSTGFRWDFLLYSMMPIVLGYYVVIKRNITDKTYTLLLNTYTLSNAFWVMVIRANYSNRFAYLSWFMYAMVLAYPLLRLDIWGPKQGKNLSLIMLGQIGFTWFMAAILGK